MSRENGQPPNWRVTLKRVEMPDPVIVAGRILRAKRYKDVDVEAENRKQARGRAQLENAGWRAVRAVKAKPREES